MSFTLTANSRRQVVIGGSVFVGLTVISIFWEFAKKPVTLTSGSLINLLQLNAMLVFMMIISMILSVGLFLFILSQIKEAKAEFLIKKNTGQVLKNGEPLITMYAVESVLLKWSRRDYKYLSLKLTNGDEVDLCQDYSYDIKTLGEEIASFLGVKFSEN